MTAAVVRPLTLPSEAALALPGSKSEANRLLAAAARAPAAYVLRGLPGALDVSHMLAGLRLMGYRVEADGQEAGCVRVGGPRDSSIASATLFCGDAGTTSRFLAAVAAVTPGAWTLTGDRHLARRPMQPLLDALRALGAEVEADAGHVPLRIAGADISAREVVVDASVSSQFASALMLVAPSLPDGLTVRFGGPVASRRYLELTARALAHLGAEAALHDDRAHVCAGFAPPRAPLQVTGDWSAMGVWTCLNHLSGSRVRGDGLVEGSCQADEAMADVLAGLRGDGPREVDVTALPDQFLNLAAVAALRDGVTTLCGAANVRAKECDRVAVMARELRRCGADLDERQDGLVVRGGAALRGAKINPEGDHRVAMAFALLGSFVAGISVEDPGCVAKSYPSFWDDLDAVHRAHRPIAVVGMRGAGKSTFGRALATALKSELVDTDEVFEAEHGPISSFVAARGWPAFRAEEERVVAAALKPGAVIATGGGAVESDPVVARLGAAALVVYLQAPAQTLRDRVEGSGRPSVTGAELVDEVSSLLARRAPRYEAAADVTIDATLPTERQVQRALGAWSASAVADPRRLQ